MNSARTILAFLGLFVCASIAQYSCTSDCGPICTLVGDVLLEGPQDVPMNTTSADDLYTTYMPFLSDADLCNSIRFEARMWDDQKGWTWVPGSELGIFGSAGDQAIYSSPILNGTGAGLCVLKHRFNPAQLVAGRKLLDGKQIRILRHLSKSNPNATCYTTFSLEGCPYSSNPNPESAGRTWQWTQASFDTDIVNFYASGIDELPGIETKVMVISLVNVLQGTAETLAGNYLIVNYNKRFITDENAQADVYIHGADLSDMTGQIDFIVRGQPDDNVPPTRFGPPPLFYGNRSDEYDTSNAAQGHYFARNTWDFWRTGFAFGPLNGPDLETPTLPMSAACFTITINNTVGVSHLRVLSYDAAKVTNSTYSGYTIASEQPLVDGETYQLHVCTCEDGVYVSPSCKSSCPISCQLEGDLILGASINDEMMTTTCGGQAMWAHDQGSIDCNSVRYEVETFSNGQYNWLPGDQLMRIVDRGQLDMYAAPFENNTEDCGMFSRFQDLQSARDMLSGRDIRFIVDRRRCYVQTHVSGCPVSFYGNAWNKTIVNNVIPYQTAGVCPTTWPSILQDTTWTLPQQNSAGISIYFYSCSDVNDFISQGDNVITMVVQVGSGNGNGIDQTVATIQVQSPDLVESFPTAFTNFAEFGGAVVNGTTYSGETHYVNGQPVSGFGLYPVNPGSCFTVTISNYSGLKRVAVGSAFPTSNKPDLRASFVLNETQLTGQTVVFNLCLCPTNTFDTTMCTPVVPLSPAASENWFEKAIESLPVQIAIGTVGTILAIASGVGLWCLIKRKKAKSEGYVKI